MKLSAYRLRRGRLELGVLWPPTLLDNTRLLQTCILSREGWGKFQIHRSKDQESEEPRELPLEVLSTSFMISVTPGRRIKPGRPSSAEVVMIAFSNRSASSWGMSAKKKTDSGDQSAYLKSFWVCNTTMCPEILDRAYLHTTC